MTIVDRQLLGYTQRHAARNDGDFVKWIRAFNHRGNHRMTGLVIRRDALFMLADDERFARNTHQHLILSAFEIFVRDRLLIHARCIQRGFVDQIGEICARESRRASGNHRDIDVFSQRDLSNVNRKDSFAPSDVGPGNNHPPVKTAGAQQCRVENIRPVGCSNQDYAFVGFKPVHLDKQLVECLLALVMSAAEACAAMPSDCVDFIYKDDARGVLLALLEQIANARGTHADEHFDEIRSADREERNIGLARDCAREKCFSGTWGAEEQYTSRNPSAKLLELLGFL